MYTSYLFIYYETIWHQGVQPPTPTSPNPVLPNLTELYSTLPTPLHPTQPNPTLSNRPQPALLHPTSPPVYCV